MVLSFHHFLTHCRELKKNHTHSGFAQVKNLTNLSKITQIWARFVSLEFYFCLSSQRLWSYKLSLLQMLMDPSENSYFPQFCLKRSVLHQWKECLRVIFWRLQWLEKEPSVIDSLLNIPEKLNRLFTYYRYSNILLMHHLDLF